jgi:hypothetical protein
LQPTFCDSRLAFWVKPLAGKKALEKQFLNRALKSFSILITQ